MFNEVRGMPQEMHDWLQEFETSNALPVRVLNGRWAQGTPVPNNNWTDRQVRDTEFTRQQASSIGLTIVTMGSAVSGSFMDYGRAMPVPQCTDPTLYSLADFIQADSGFDFGENEPILWTANQGSEMVYGEVADRVVYYYWNLADNARMAASIWDYNLLFAPLEDACDGDGASERMQRLIDQSFDNFMEYMSEERLNRQVGVLRTNINAWEREIADQQRHIAERIQQARGASTQLQAILNSADQSREEWEQQFRMVADNPAVETVLFRPGRLRIMTNPITLRGRGDYEGETRYLGRFKIEVNLTTFGITLHNRENPQGGRDHPHVPEGRPCFGGNASEFTNLLGQGQFGIFIELMIQWLENYNPLDDWGAYASNWFDIDDRAPEFEQVAEETTEVEEGAVA